MTKSRFMEKQQPVDTILITDGYDDVIVEA